jgi:hypothetical protein
MNEINNKYSKSISHKKNLHHLPNKIDKPNNKIPLYKTFNSKIKKNESTNTHNLLFSDREQEFGNEFLIKAMKRNSDKIELKEYLDDKNNIIKKEFDSDINKYSNSIHINSFISNKNSARKNRIKSAKPLILNYKKNFKNVKNLIEINKCNNYNNNIYEDVQKILAYKENIFVHEKNLSLLENYKGLNNISNKNSKKNSNNSTNDNNENIYKTPKNKIIDKYNRPKSAMVEGEDNYENNSIKINHLHLDNFQKKSNKILIDNNYDLSYIANKSYNNKRIRIEQNKTSNDKLLITSTLDHLSNNSMKRASNCFERSINYHELENLNHSILQKKLINKKNRGYLLRRRPIPESNEKYLIYLPSNLKKDIKNKYNFLSFLVTDNIYYNTADNKNYFNSKKIGIKNSHKNRTKHNKTEFLNLDKDYKLNCRKEEEFMTYLKKLDYISKHPKKGKNSYHTYREEFFHAEKHRYKNIYKPVKICSNENKIFGNGSKKENENEKNFLNDEDMELCETIKSHPFHLKHF